MADVPASSKGDLYLSTGQAVPSVTEHNHHGHVHSHGTNGDTVPTAENTFNITIRLPHHPFKTQTIISTQDQAQDIRQSITDAPHTFQYSCFHLEIDGQRLPEFVDLASVSGIGPDAELTLVENPYTEKDARVHFLRVRELIGAVGDKTDVVQGIHAGATLHDQITRSDSSASNGHPMTGYDPDSPATADVLFLPAEEAPTRTLKSISVSHWNPPPYYLRSRGHLLYIQVTTNEGEQSHITAHVTGFYVNKSTNGKFDPSPKTSPKPLESHSLLTLLAKISPSFDASFKSLQAVNAPKDPLSTFQLSNAIPASPWLVSQKSSSLSSHLPDLCRTQESFLVNGADNAESLRDWNEEFQTTRELPSETVQDRIFRERVASKLFADYNEAATTGAVLIARGEITPLNPTEPSDAHIFVYNNIFFSFGADGVGTFAKEGGDEAARVATGKDVMGVKTVNQLDILDLSTPGTVIVDYLGHRIVAQSIVPGIFKQREPGEQQIDYGGVEGKDVVAENEAFAPLFEKLSSALHIKKHPVWDKDCCRHDLEASIETKGLLGTDGRKYALDLYRITPLDVHWVERFWDAYPNEQSTSDTTSSRYPHRMAVFRPELVDTYWRLKLREYVKAELAKKPSESSENKPGEGKQGSEEHAKKANGVLPENATETNDKDDNDAQHEAHGDERVDMSHFKYAFNPDVFGGQQPQTDDEKREWAKDEAEVRALSAHLRERVLPQLLTDLLEGEIGFPMDGQSLSSLLHKRGINVRYLGSIADLANKPESRLSALRALAVREMVARAFKHVANSYLRKLALPVAASCVAHLLNCLMCSKGSATPVVEIDQDLRSLFAGEISQIERFSPQELHSEVARQVMLRYRFELEHDWVSKIQSIQMVREISLKLGLQLAAKSFSFSSDPSTFTSEQGPTSLHTTNGLSSPATNGHSTGSGRRKKKGGDKSPSRDVHTNGGYTSQPFHAEDVYNIVPVIKEASPRSALAEEALEAGRVSLAQNQRSLGQELLLESLSLHEQIYGILHAEVARVYYQLSSLFYGLDDKPIAVELARKAVIVSERTLGLDNHETVLAYLNLGIFEHAAGNTRLALMYVRHALNLWKLVYGINHPDSITTLNNAAVMLQHLKLYHDSRVWFEVSLGICQRMSGSTSVNTATLLFQLAQALALDQDSKAAVSRMREAYNIFHAALGPDDRNTKEAETWLEQLTQNAVSIAKHAKDVQARRLRRLNNLTPRMTLSTRHQAPVNVNEHDVVEVARATGRRSGSLRLDERSIDELLKYIEGGETAKQSLPKKRPANPKRRQQRT